MQISQDWNNLGGNMPEDTGAQCKTPVPLREYLNLQIKEITGPDNMYYTGLNVGHPPSQQEAAQNYVERGGADNFAQRFVPEGLLRNQPQTPSPQ